MKVIMIVLLLTEDEARSFIQQNFIREYGQYVAQDKEFVDKYFTDEYERLKYYDNKDKYVLFDWYYGEPKLSEFFTLFDIPKSDGSGTFKIETISSDLLDVMEFDPLAHEAEQTDSQVFVVMADRQPSHSEVIADGAYGNLADLRDEMKSRFSKYMPEDFKWDEHIGVLSGEPSF